MSSSHRNVQKFRADLQRAVRKAQMDGAAPIARKAIKVARSANADQVTFRCENDGWTTTASSEATLKQRIGQHYRSSRHRI